MSNEENPQGRPAEGRGFPPEHGGWQPTPQGEYDAEATAFVQLPPEDALHAAPLEAPGHGYVPPMILPLTPAADPQVPQGMQGMGGAWPPPGTEDPRARDAHAHDPYPYADRSAHPDHQHPDHRHPDRPHPDDPHATGQWVFAEAEQPPAPATDVTGQWTIPVARGDLPEETGEFTASMLQAQWNSAPATLPGGATAPWAAEPPATLPGGAPAPWAQEARQEPSGTPPQAGAPAPATAEPPAHSEPAAHPEHPADPEHSADSAHPAHHGHPEPADSGEPGESAENPEAAATAEAAVAAAIPEAAAPAAPSVADEGGGGSGRRG
ncbi:(2Fe-2S)-binding protein, partial [Streptomyces sp. NPDC004726]